MICLDKYADPTRSLRIRVRFLVLTTALFAFLAVIAARQSAHWKETALRWEYQALSGNRGDGL